MCKTDPTIDTHFHSAGGEDIMMNVVSDPYGAAVSISERHYMEPTIVLANSNGSRMAAYSARKLHLLRRHVR